MEFNEFKSKPKFDAKVFILNGEEDFFKYLTRTIIQKKFADSDKVYANTEMDTAEFYERIEPNEIIPQPKVIYVDNTEGELSKFKGFWSAVRTSDKDVRYILNSCKAKEIPEDVATVEIVCPKIKDNAREVGAFVGEMVSALGLVIDPKNVPFFFHLYRNNLFLIYNELKKCQWYAEHTGQRELTYPVLKKILSPASQKDVFALSTNFMKRKLKACFLDLEDIPETEVPLHLFNIFKAAERLLVYKTATANGMSYDFNQFFVKYTLKEQTTLWNVSELRDLMLVIEAVLLKTKSFNYPAGKCIVNLVLHYCR